MACVLEASAPKPGNVHPGASFEDATFNDFVASAVASWPVFRQAETKPVGQFVLEAVRTTQVAVGTNTNLGTILLLAPLAAVPVRVPCREGIGRVLERLDADDCRDVYEAIRAAHPGGLGETTVADVHETPPGDLMAAMSLAADRDLVAQQYAHGFSDIWEFVLPALIEFKQQSRSIGKAIGLTQLATMARVRTLGSNIATVVQGAERQ